MISHEPATTVGEVSRVLEGLREDTPLEPVRIELDWEGDGPAVLRLIPEQAEKSPGWRLIVHDLDDPPRRIMEERLENLLSKRGEASLVTIERIPAEKSPGGLGDEDQERLLEIASARDVLDVPLLKPDDAVFLRKLAEHTGPSDDAGGTVKLGDIAKGVEAMARREYEVAKEELGSERSWEEETQAHRNIYLDAARERLTIALEALAEHPTTREGSR